MTNVHPGLESAIPAHLAGPAVYQPKHTPGSYTPPYPSGVARFTPNVATVVMAYFGIQHRDPDLAQARASLREIAEAFDEKHGPGHWDRARYVDAQGYTTTLSIGYWDDPAEFDRWHASFGEGWTSLDRLDGSIGYFVEIVRPPVERFETLFSASDRLEGVSVTADHLSDPVEEHAYWGGMRDRIPAARQDALAHSGALQVTIDGPLRVVTGHDNICLIRSGQDITDTLETERQMYVTEVEPVLRAGMDFIRDEGTTIGCYNNRYVTVLDENDQPIGKTFGMSWWNDMASLELWSKEHPTHVAIFGAAMRHLSTFGPDTKLRLYHEVTVTTADQQSFRYLNCHDRTGLLNALA
jgi:aldoxime dehydratase